MKTKGLQKIVVLIFSKKFSKFELPQNNRFNNVHLTSTYKTFRSQILVEILKLSNSLLIKPIFYLMRALCCVSLA